MSYRIVHLSAAGDILFASKETADVSVLARDFISTLRTRALKLNQTIGVQSLGTIDEHGERIAEIIESLRRREAESA